MCDVGVSYIYVLEYILFQGLTHVFMYTCIMYTCFTVNYLMSVVIFWLTLVLLIVYSSTGTSTLLKYGLWILFKETVYGGAQNNIIWIPKTFLYMFTTCIFIMVQEKSAENVCKLVLPKAVFCMDHGVQNVCMQLHSKQCWKLRILLTGTDDFKLCFYLKSS